ncbi:Hypothetical predicted protein [Paramuricea clavata]|uniref:Uncharacterized protein n=1 Tax=Paramuricea clavata TaxID=317549 RepID=A0A7D9ENJ7_PARCT|nr:Hypothetical predicted protein [Paramuricea clavata]
MSILLGYDYFDTAAEDINTLKQKLTVVQKGQQENTAAIVAHTNDIKKLNSLGQHSEQYNFTQIPGYSPGVLQTPIISDLDRKNAKFTRLNISDGKNTATSSSLYGFYVGSAGTIVVFTRDQSSRIIQASFTFFVPGDTTKSKVQIFGMKSRDIDSAGNVTNKTKTTNINYSLLTT